MNHASEGPSTRRIRVLALLESQWGTGPAKNLLAFGEHLRNTPSGSGIELSLATFQRPSSPADRFVSALREAGIAAHVIEERHAGDPRAVGQFLKIVRSAQPDILQTHNSKSHLLAVLTGLAKRMPWIAFFHGLTNRDARDRFYNRIGWWALRRAPHIVTVCRAFAANLVDAGVPEARITVRHNIVAPYRQPPPAETAALRSSLGIERDERIVLAVGRLSREKGQADLIDAIALLGRGRELGKVRLVLVGDGPDRALLEQRACDTGIAGSVIFTGSRDADAVWRFYALADVFALPSHSEGSPNVLLEAMAAGLPIVATDAGGIPELVADGSTALLVERQSPRALGGAVGQLLDDAGLASRLGAAARLASVQYTPQAYTEALVAVYRTALAQHPVRTAARR